MQHNGQWHKRQWQRIEEEYQEPAREVVRVYHHEMRIPLCRVAELLYISENTLRNWCKIWKLETRSRGYTKRETMGKVQFRARSLGYNDVSQAISDMRAGGLRWDDICLRLKCASSTISRYMTESAKGYCNVSEAGRKAKQETARRLNERMARGEVQRGGFAKTPLGVVHPQRHYDTGSRL